MPPVISSFTGDYEFLSNFYKATVRVWGMDFATLEHAYQAAKADDPAERQKFAAYQPSRSIRTLMTAADAKKAGRRVKLRGDWELVKNAVMYELLKRKFYEHSDLAERLMETDRAILIEGNWWGDRYWGVCDGPTPGGENWLGKLLMLRRAELHLGNL